MFLKYFFMRVCYFFPWVVFFIPSGLLLGEVHLPSIFSEHMVLARAGRVPVWGKAEPGEEVTVTMDGQSVKTKAATDGKWRLDLNLKDSPQGPFEMTVQGWNRILIRDVVVGEVWLAGGQSNMELSLKRIVKSADDVANSANPFLRQFEVGKTPSSSPAEDCPGFWAVANPGTVGEFSATGYYFGRILQKELGCPVGIIKDCWGGTSIEPWISPAALATVPFLETSATEALERDATTTFAFESWLKQTHREDHSSGDVSAFVSGPASAATGWTAVKSSGEISSSGLPKSGAVWFRKKVTLSEGQTNIPQVLELAQIGGFDRVFWNGKLLGETTLQTFSGDRAVHRFFIPASLAKAGTNDLAIRLYSPILVPGFSWPPQIAPTILAGEWQAKAELELPPPDTVTSPRPPKLIPQQAFPGKLFNGMIHPFIPYAISGVIWYQGEGNSKHAHDYRTAFPLLIKDWRQQWQQGDFPFYYCQLANFRAKEPGPQESDWAELREAQSMALSMPMTGQAVLIDTGESEDIHPQDKATAGERLAKIALACTYGKEIPFSGPLYQSMRREDGKIRLSFVNAEGGLVAGDLPSIYPVKIQTGTTAPLIRNSPQSQLEGFAVCGEDRKWVWAEAKVEGETVLVWSDKVPVPVAVRYAWADNPTCNLYSKAGFPASPFRTDDFPGITEASKP